MTQPPPSAPPVIPAATDPAAPPTTATTPPVDPAAPPAAVSEPLHDDPAIDAVLQGLAPEQREKLLTTGGQKALEAQREEARRAKAERDAANERTKAILKAAGIDTGDEDPVRVLEATRAQNQTLADQLRSERVRNGLTAAALRGGTDPVLTAALLTYQGSLTDLDPTSVDFPAALDALVLQARTADPRIASATSAPAANGHDFRGGNPTDRPDIDADIADATEKKQWQRVITLKNLKSQLAAGKA